MAVLGSAVVGSAKRWETLGLLTSVVESPHSGPPQECSITFRWSNRTCAGNELHRAALVADLPEVRRLLAERPKAVNSRFSYVTYFNGVRQEGSGEAIHLAVSRSIGRAAQEVVQELLRAGANVDAKVTRDFLDHYDVMHAAVFSEGRGGDVRMVQFLLDARADLVPNLDGKWPLHMAFQTGQANLIQFLIQEHQQQGVLELAEDDSKGVPSPVQIGIQMRKLNEAQLSQVAPLTPKSLLIFIQEEPKCIPSFLDRWFSQDGLSAENLSKLVTTAVLSKLLSECPEAADALLNALSSTPECESEGWHPLPSRMSFAPVNFYQRLQNALNPPRDRFSVYVPDRHWNFDMQTFHAPAWHTKWTDSKLRPIRDVRIRVCQVPDLIRPEFVAALCEAAEDDTLAIFNNRAIRSMLELVWWKGAIRVDILQVVLSVWGLCLLVLETGLAAWTEHEVSDHISIDFVAARAVVDVLHEFAQLAGYVKIGRTANYFTDWGNVYDIFRCLVPALLFFDRYNRVVRVLVILIYWMRILELNFSESLSRELLPIIRLARGLGPASIVAFIGFCGLTHAFYALGELDGDFNKSTSVILESFSMLITGSIPDGTHCDTLRMFLTYTSILMFTVFFLNIFIGVIGENYSIQKGLSPLVFQNVRSGCCCAFLLRASCIPAFLCQPCVAGAASAFAGAVALGIQVANYMGTRIGYAAVSFALCQTVMVLAAYQNPSAPWGRSQSNSAEQEPHYLWYAEAIEPEAASQLDSVQRCLYEVRDLLRSVCPHVAEAQRRPDNLERSTRSPRTAKHLTDVDDEPISFKTRSDKRHRTQIPSIRGL